MAPLTPIFEILAYITGCLLRLSGELSEELVNLTLRFRFYKPEIKQIEHMTTVRFRTYSYFTSPLPYRYMVLSDTQLLQEFVGWWHKIAGRTPTFLDKLHRFEMHKVLFVSLFLLNCRVSTVEMISSMRSVM